MTAIAAFALLPLYTALVERYVINGGHTNAQLTLVAFHTGFNTLAAAVMLGFTRPFARLIERLVPERGPPLVGNLDPLLLKEPAAAVDAAVASIGGISGAAFSILADALRPEDEPRQAQTDPETVENARRLVFGFVSDAHTSMAQPVAHQRHLAAMHALDHLKRLAERCRQTDRLETLRSEPRLRHLTRQLHDFAEAVATGASQNDAVAEANNLRKRFRDERHGYRQSTLVQATRGFIDDDIALRRLDAIRWLHRTAYHVWRILHHLAVARSQVAIPEALENGEEPNSEGVYPGEVLLQEDLQQQDTGDTREPEKPEVSKADLQK